MSRSKDASSKLHEKHQTILADLLRDEDNKYCADCLSKGPRWASWNLGVFMCIRCAGIHRNLGVHISRVKSVNLDAWTPEQIESIQKGGNGRAKRTYEANLPANFRRPQDDYAVEQFIRAKYERKQYISRGGSSEPSSKQASAKEEPKAKSKAKKASSSAAPQKHSTEQISMPRPSGRSPSPQIPRPTPSTASSSSSSSSSSTGKAKGSSLISLDTGSSSKPSSKKSSPQPSVDLLTGLPVPSTASSPNDRSSSSGSSSSSSNSSVTNPPPLAEQLFGGAPTQQRPQATGSGSNAKDSIMSLYGAQNQPQLTSYTAQGYPVNSLYYQQQQAAAMRMAHVAAMQQHQVNQVTAQMQQIKMTTQQHPPPMATAPQGYQGMSNGGGPGMGVRGGQTLNPTLW